VGLGVASIGWDHGWDQVLRPFDGRGASRWVLQWEMTVIGWTEQDGMYVANGETCSCNSSPGWQGGRGWDVQQSITEVGGSPATVSLEIEFLGEIGEG
jgi:hypothetical protein